MFWLYVTPAVGGVLIVIYGLMALVGPPDGSD